MFLNSDKPKFAEMKFLRFQDDLVNGGSSPTLTKTKQLSWKCYRNKRRYEGHNSELDIISNVQTSPKKYALVLNTLFETILFPRKRKKIKKKKINLAIPLLDILRTQKC